jgi:uncharacterized protein YrrD/uncharacterized protein YjbJ (UPF0337 family)
VNIEQQIVERTKLLNRLVLDRATAEEVGRVEALWLDSKANQVVGLTCKSGFLGRQKHFFTWGEIQTIGADSLMVSLDENRVEPDSPQPSDTLVGQEVWTDAGNKVGQLVDYLFATQTGIVVGYLFKSSGWRGIVGDTYLLSPEDIVSMGSKRVIVSDSAVQTPQEYTEGMSKKLNKVGELFQEDYDKTLVDLRGLIKGAQNLSEQARGKVQEVAGQAQEGAQSFAEQARDRAGQVGETAREGMEHLSAEAKERAKQAQEKFSEMTDRGVREASPQENRPSEEAQTTENSPSPDAETPPGAQNS